MKGEISRNETNAATLAVSHVIPLLVSAVVYAVIAVSAVMMCSCTGRANSNSNLKKAIAVANSMCPIDYGNGSKLESIKYDESRNEATMTLSVDGGSVDIATLKSNETIVKQMLCASFSQGSGNQWMVELANAGASFKAVFKEMPSGKTAEFTFTAEEVKGMAKGNVPQTGMNQGLDAWVATQNKACPQNLGDGISITQVAREGNNVVMYVQVDNENMDYLRSNAGDIEATKDEILAELAGDGVVRLLVSNGAGYVYRFFVDDPTDCVDIKFTVDELRGSIN